MPRDSTRTLQRILTASYKLFYRKGYYRTSLDDIAAASGVTKRTLYYHFESKDELLAAVLDLHQELALERIRGWGDQLRGGSAAQVIDALFANLARWSAQPGWTGAGLTRLSMELADMPGHPARKVARRHKAAVEAWFTELLESHGVASPREGAQVLELLTEGVTAMVLISGDRGFATVAARAAKKLLQTGANT
jgi:AcrR family transcriptional regulator